MWVHVGNPTPIFADHTVENVAGFAQNVTVPTYAPDDDSAILVNGHGVRIVSEGVWSVFPPGR